MAPVRRPEPPDRDERFSWERRVVRAEVDGRRVNEAIQRGRAAADDAAVFICECGRVGCTSKLHLSLDEYDHVRGSFERFLIAPGHEIAGVDEVTEDHDDYLVAVKTGSGSALAEQTDPRG